MQEKQKLYSTNKNTCLIKEMKCIDIPKFNYCKIFVKPWKNNSILKLHCKIYYKIRNYIKVL